MRQLTVATELARTRYRRTMNRLAQRDDRRPLEESNCEIVMDFNYVLQLVRQGTDKRKERSCITQWGLNTEGT